MSTQTVPQISAEFVADARKHWVPVARWLRTQREWDHLRLRRWDREVEIHIDEVWGNHALSGHVVVVAGKSRIRQTFYVTSIGQAVDFLVVAEILPAELASWGVPVCVCWDGNYGNYEGMRPECPVHGAVRALNEASRKLDALRAKFAELSGATS